jgi:hypothetical protein
MPSNSGWKVLLWRWRLLTNINIAISFCLFFITIMKCLEKGTFKRKVVDFTYGSRGQRLEGWHLMMTFLQAQSWAVQGIICQETWSVCMCMSLLVSLPLIKSWEFNHGDSALRTLSNTDYLPKTLPLNTIVKFLPFFFWYVLQKCPEKKSLYQKWFIWIIHFLFYLLIIFIVVLGYIVAFTKVLTIYQICQWNSPPPSFSPIPGIVSTGFIFPFMYM